MVGPQPADSIGFESLSDLYARDQSAYALESVGCFSNCRGRGQPQSVDHIGVIVASACDPLACPSLGGQPLVDKVNGVRFKSRNEALFPQSASLVYRFDENA